MEPLRLALISALAVVTYLLFLQWQEDYGRPTIPPEQTISASVDSAVENITDGSRVSHDIVADAPSAQDESLQEDLPDVSAPTAATSNLVEETIAAPSEDLISVETDIFSIKIDPRGGDIVYAALKKYPIAVEYPDNPFVLLNNTSAFTYVAQSGVIGPKRTDMDSKSRPLYFVDRSEFKLEGDTLIVPLTYQVSDFITAKKTFTFNADDYSINVQHQINNQSANPWQGIFFAQIKRDGSKDPGISDAGGFGLPTYLGAAYWKPDEKYNKLGFDDIADAQAENRKALNETIQGGWVALIQHYFLSAWIPNKDQNHKYTSKVNSRGQYIVGLTSQPVVVQPGTSETISSTFYVGPKIQKNLEALSDGLNLAIDYGFLFFISDFLFMVLSGIHTYVVANWGWAIILLTVLVKLAFYPLSAASYRSMANMRRMQPELVRLKERYGDDRQAMSQAMMKLYKEEKINPLGGCLPILLQMPVFLALYWALLESVELRHAEWIGWIKDLSEMDPYFILPVLMGASMFFQQKLNPTPPDPMQAKVMQFMPIIFTVFFLFFPAGLVLYWLTNNILSIAQQWYITNQIESEAAAKKK